VDTEPKQDIRAKNYPCDSCPARSEKTCAHCIFARWNVEGIMNAFSPKPAAGDFSNSPLIMRVADSPAAWAQKILNEVDAKLHPKLGQLIVPSYNRMAELTSKM